MKTKKIKLESVKEFKILTRKIEHPKEGALYIIMLDENVIEVIGKNGPVDFSEYEGHLKVGSFLTKSESGDFGPLQV